MTRFFLAPIHFLLASLFTFAGLGLEGCGVLEEAASPRDGGGGASAGNAGAAGHATPPSPPLGWDDAIRLPAAMDRDLAPDVVEIDLEARLAPVEILPGIITQAWTYGGTLPGPLIRVPVGARLIVHFKNMLPDETTIHWHGVQLPADMDGVPVHSQPAVPTGGSFDYSFIVPDSGLFWYHPHVRSAQQVGDGLYGALLVESRPSANTTSAAGGGTAPTTMPDLGPELVLVLSDVDVNPDGTLGDAASSGDLATLFGREGNVVLVNGRVGPTVKARPGQRQRWRIVNTSKSRYFQLAIAGHKFTRIGGDGGFIPIPRESGMLVLTPGERADVLMTFQGPRDTVLPVRWVPYNRGFGSVEFRDEIPVFYVRLTDDAPVVDAPTSLPATLRTIAPLDVRAVLRRDLDLTQNDVDGKVALGINGVPSWDAEPLHVRVGDTEVWNIRNTMEWDHPFHLHGFFFQVVDPATGAPPAVTEWKDTVNVPRHETVAVAVRFDARPGMWMFHCHILDHADAGMMGMVHLSP
jgi:FtsP/CotA-like multicopper oxidase with cupredoxin domain